jgi:serine/threonine protein kinase/beta-lactam-binding protein with PASTA domain
MSDGLGLGIEHLADVQLIGSGGFSVVYAARHTLFDRRVAVKVLTNVKSDSDKRRFERECQVMGRLSGAPNVVTVFHAAYTTQDQPYLIMELVEGGTLADRVDTQGPFAWHEAVDLLIPTSAALGYAHDEGILHRDIKPENILLDDGVPKLTDFGIAQLRDSTGTASTHIAASWLHAPPETFDNERDERSDLYSLASTAHSVIAGTPPFWREADESLHPLVNRLLNEPPPELPDHLAPPELRAFLLQAMAKDPAERPQTAGDFTAALAHIRGVSAPNPQVTVAGRDPELTRHVGGLLAPPPGFNTNPTTLETPAAGPTPSTSTAETVVVSSNRSSTGEAPASIPQPGHVPTAEQTPSTDAQVPTNQHASVRGFALGGAAAAAAAAANPAHGTPAGPAGAAAPGPGQGGQGPNVQGQPVLQQGGGWPDTGGRPDTGNYRQVVYEEPKRRFGLLGALLLVVLLGGGAAIAWWVTQPDDGAAADSDIATGDIEGQIPNLVGLTEDAAIDELDALGIEVGEITRRASSTAEEGVVIGQTPDGGSDEGPVDLIVSSGPDGADDEEEVTPTVPDVVGLTEDDAIERLEALGIIVSVSGREESTTVEEGRVISQDPDEGAEATLVRLTVSTGDDDATNPEPPTVPDVRGMSEAAAINALDDRGITATIGSREESDSVDEGDVIDQSPGPGASSDSVTLTISTGPAAGGVTIDQITFSPTSPAELEVGENLSISIDYTSNHSGPIQMWARPTSGDYGASGSQQLDPGSGTHPQSFRLQSPGVVTRVRVHAVDAETDELLAERFVDVSFTWSEVDQTLAAPGLISPANGSVFDFFPRTTTLSWSSVPNASSYSVEIQFFSGGGWTTHGTSTSGLGGTSYTFDFVGAQPGRWRVWAVDANGEPGDRSGWWEFEYLR